MAARRKYDWEGWFGRGAVTLLRGVDYHCSQSTMVQTIRNNATRCGVRVRVLDNGNSISLRVVDEISHTYPTTVPLEHPTPLA